MIRIDQAHTVAEHGWGDCFSACLASLLECDLEEVPQFNRLGQEGEYDGPHAAYPGFAFHVGAWLRERGHCAIQVGQAVELWKWGMVGVPFIVGGPSNRTDRGHAVIAEMEDEWGGLRWLHDPHPSREFLHGEPFEFWFVLPLPSGCREVREGEA